MKNSLGPRHLIGLLLFGVFVMAGFIALNQFQAESSQSTSRSEAPGPNRKRWTNSIGMDLVQIPSGRFTMGSNSSESDSYEKPSHTVIISRSFYMATTEVTQGQWKAVVGTNPSKFQGDDLPVEQVSWNDAKEFIRRLNIKDGRIQYRLPTEAEWEYACKAGTVGDQNGNLDSVVWYSTNSGNRTHPVGQKPANAWGLYDMLGNVYEWCEDWKGDYSSGNVTDPIGPSVGQYRVIRGGSWLIHANRAKSYFRDFFSPEYGRSDIGFRIVAVVRTS